MVGNRDYRAAARMTGVEAVDKTEIEAVFVAVETEAVVLGPVDAADAAAHH